MAWLSHTFPTLQKVCMNYCRVNVSFCCFLKHCELYTKLVKVHESERNGSPSLIVLFFMASSWWYFMRVSKCLLKGKFFFLKITIRITFTLCVCVCVFSSLLVQVGWFLSSILQHRICAGGTTAGMTLTGDALKCFHLQNIHRDARGLAEYLRHASSSLWKAAKEICLKLASYTYFASYQRQDWRFSAFSHSYLICCR